MTTYQKTVPCSNKWCKKGWMTATKDGVPTLCTTCDNHTGTVTTDITLEEIVQAHREDVLKILGGEKMWAVYLDDKVCVHTIKPRERHAKEQAVQLDYDEHLSWESMEADGYAIKSVHVIQQKGE